MTATSDIKEILQGYVKLTEFLGKVLGSDYEIVFHDLTDPNHSIVAIENGHISGREVGAPLTNVALSVLKDKGYENEDYRVNDYGLSASGKQLRSNTLFIKHEGKLIGMLCINFDDSRYKDVVEHVMALAHPQNFLHNINMKEADLNKKSSSVAAKVTEQYNSSPEGVAEDAINKELESMGLTADRLTAEERMHVIAALEKKGIFLLKGVVKDVAAGLKCSQASIYRYMSQLKIGDVS